MPCVVCGRWVNEERVGEAIQDAASDWYYFCHSACRCWLSNLNFNLVLYGASSYDASVVDDQGDLIHTSDRLYNEFQ
jgi:hypothetical protein